MGQILVIRGGAIGDFVLTLPVLAALRQQFPQARLEVLGYAHIASLALVGGLADAVRSIEAGALAGFFAPHGTLSPELADYFRTFNIIVSYLYDPDEIFRANIARCSQAQYIQGPHRPDESASLPASKILLQPLERLAIFDADHIPRLVLPAQTASTSSDQERRKLRLAAHPGSGSEAKNWSATRWIELLDKLAGETEILLISGEAESERMEPFLRRLSNQQVERAHHLPLVDLAARLQQCDAFIGHDSGISHLAAALGLPGVVLWGPSAEVVWRPPSAKVIVLRDPAGLAGLQVERALSELRQLASVLGRRSRVAKDRSEK